MGNMKGQSEKISRGEWKWNNRDKKITRDNRIRIRNKGYQRYWSWIGSEEQNGT